MPSQLFFNLPQEKQERIVTAAYHEFSDHVFEKASVRRILAEANIGTGSFYRYFESKDELYLYVIDLMFNELNGMKDKQGEAYERLYQSPIWEMFKQSSPEFRKKYYFRLDPQSLYEMQLGRVRQMDADVLKDEKHRKSVAFLFAVLPYVQDELSRLSGEDFDSEWLFLRNLVIKGLEKS